MTTAQSRFFQHFLPFSLIGRGKELPPVVIVSPAAERPLAAGTVWGYYVSLIDCDGDEVGRKVQPASVGDAAIWQKPHAFGFLMLAP